MKPRRKKILLALLLAPLALALLVAIGIAVFGWNWVRGPVQQMVQARTGRALVIDGDLHIDLGWPALRVQAQSVRFANPPWAKETQLLTTDDVEFSVDLPALLQWRLVFPEVRLSKPVVMLEAAADGRKSWLLDTQQSDENAHVFIEQLTLDHGQLGFDDSRVTTHIRMDLDTPDARTGTVIFRASGSYKGMPLMAKGQGASVLTLREERTPYAFAVDATVGGTGIKAQGSVTGLLSLSAVDLLLTLRGDSLAQLFPLLGIGLPQTHAYVTSGRLVRSGSTWRYDKFKGLVGHSDVAGSLQVEQSGVRPFLRGDVVSQVLDLDDLGPVIGARSLPEKAELVEPNKENTRRVLPNLPFEPARWRAFDADVTLHAASIQRAKALPLDRLVARMQLHDAVLELNPLEFAAAGGRLVGAITLDARQEEIKATAQVHVRQIALGKLFPTVVLTKSGVGQINGEFDLSGHGNSVNRMLATANGGLRLVMEQGEISRLLMEKMGLHVLEIVGLSLAGDKTTALRCAVADFTVHSGVMNANALLLDTAVNTVVGTGTIDLAQEALDLTFVPHTHNTSLVALRSPIHVGGTLGTPVVRLDMGRVLARGAGALALGVLNPLLALIPLVETGPGVQNECGRLLPPGGK